MSPEVLIELVDLHKSFGQVSANQEIRLKVRPGTIHAIIGENGAGKSTAMKMLYGIYPPDSGRILIRGQEQRWKSPADAISAGIGMVHQHFMLAGPYTALENVILGAESTRSGFLDRDRARKKLNQISEQYGLKVDWDAKVEELPVGLQQRLEIIKLLYRSAEILILDEPTAVLTPQEVTDFFVNLKKLALQGKTILIITHKLKEVLSLADDVTVFRGGRTVAERKVKDTTADELATLMVGRKVNLTVQAPEPPRLGEVVLDVRDLSLWLHGKPEKQKLRKVSFSVRGGEILGVAGVEGNGQSDLLNLMIGLRDPRYSRVEGAIQAKDYGFIPEDRHRDGLLLDSSVEENFLLGLQREKEFQRGGVILKDALSARVGRAIQDYDIRPRSSSIHARNLSGGNQQKVVIARELHASPRLLIAAQPTRGVDIGAIEFIHSRILDFRKKGNGVLLISSELDEVLALSDRIIVIFDGQIVAEFTRGEADERSLGLHMGGAKAQ